MEAYMRQVKTQELANTVADLVNVVKGLAQEIHGAPAAAVAPVASAPANGATAPGGWIAAARAVQTAPAKVAKAEAPKPPRLPWTLAGHGVSKYGTPQTVYIRTMANGGTDRRMIPSDLVAQIKAGL